MSQDTTSRKRTIRSFVKRISRMTEGQKSALDNLWLSYGIDNTQIHLNLDTHFARYAPRTLEIGSGMGETTVSLALANPTQDFLAVEVHLPGVGSLMHQANTLELTNIKVIADDINMVLDERLPDGCMHTVSILFPDPWPKKRHHKRRLIQMEFLDKLIRVMRKNGRLFMATDWQDYAQHMLQTCDRHERLVNLAGEGHFSPRPFWRPVTKFEKRGIELGHRTWDLLYRLK